MINAVRSEFTKLVSLRSTWMFSLLLLAFTVLPAIVIPLFSDREQYTWDEVTAAIFVVIALAITFTGSKFADDYSTNVHVYSILTQKTRNNRLVAKGIVMFVFLAILVAIGLGVSVLLVKLNPSTTFVPDKAGPLYANLMVLVFYGVVASFCAVLTRSKAATVSIPIIWMFIVDSLLTVLAQQFTKFTFLWWLSPLARAQQLGDWIVNAPTDSVHGWAIDELQPVWFNVTVLVGGIDRIPGGQSHCQRPPRRQINEPFACRRPPVLFV